MSQHPFPFFDSAEEATKHAIQSSGKALKEVAIKLWPGKTMASAQTHLANCLNANRDEKLTADEHAFIAEFCGQYDFLHYLAHRLSHSRPVPVAPEDQHAKLQREFVEAVQRLGQIKSQLDTSGQRLRSAA